MCQFSAQRNRFATFSPVGEHHYATRGVGGTAAAEGHAVFIIKIIGLHAVGKALSRLNQLFQLRDDRHINLVFLAVAAFIFIAGTVQVRIEHAGHALFAQQDKGVGQRLEPGFDRCFQRL
ncbi:hypothetical protein D3C78_1484860 [compost metagenome]